LGAKRTERDIKPEIAFSMTNNLDAYRYYSLALEQIQMAQFTEAVALMEKAIALDPQFAMAHARIGYIYSVLQGLGEKGKPYFDKAFQFLERLNDKEKLYVTAWAASINYDTESAIKTYKQLIDGYPLEVEAYQRMSLLLHRQNRDEEALQILKQAIVFDPESKDLHNILGIVYLYINKQAEAQAAFERYVELAPNDPNACDSLGNFHQFFGKYILLARALS